MNGQIYLIGGGEISKNETQQIDKHVMESVRKEGGFVFFPTAANDSEDYTQQIFSIYSSQYNCKAITAEMTDEEMTNTLENAAIVYLGGGKTELLLDFFEKRSLLPLLSSALNNGAIIVGMSAGAQALSTHYIDEANTLQKGWGLVPVCTLVHATAKTTQEAVETHKAEATELPFYGISEGAALVYSDEDYLMIGEIYRNN